MPPHIMVVEDDPSARRLIGFVLEKEGFELTACEHGRMALDALDHVRPDIFVVDMMMPVMDGVQLIKELRERSGYEKAPILVLTARDQMVDKYEAFSAGADDYVTKPFDPLELLFRVRSFLRRLEGSDAARTDATPQVGRVRLEPGTFTAFVEGREVQLTRLETAVLQYLMARTDQVIPAEQLATRALDQGDGSRSVDAAHAHIRHLRRKIEQDPARPSILVTVGRKGYRFVG